MESSNFHFVAISDVWAEPSSLEELFDVYVRTATGEVNKAFGNVTSFWAGDLVSHIRSQGFYVPPSDPSLA